LQVPGKELLQSAAPFLDAWPELRLECLPNRDSLQYETTYGIENVKTLFRGTLRYSGFSSLMHVFQNMGMFESFSAKDANTWDDLLGSLCRSRGGFESVEDFMLACAEDDPEEAIRARECLEWLGLSGNSKVASTHGANVVELFCQRLEEKLFYGENERDMVVMHHTIGAQFEDGTTEEHHSSLQTFGDRSMTAMCKTVGFTAAASTELILSGSLQGNRGLLLPTLKEIYVPVLEAVKREGIIFEETVKVVEPASSTLPLY
jgi:alpha-aminoadipic semialdehyde synthase